MGGREVGGMANLLSGHRDLASRKDRDEVAALWGVRSVPGRPGKTAVELFDSLGKEVRMVWIACTNPVASMPDALAVRRALAKAEFVVVQEAWLDAEICDYADVLLPAATWAEKEGTVTNSERRISRVRAAVAPPGEARPDWKIAAEFARRLGGERLFPYEKSEDVFNEHRETTRGRDLDITGLSYAILEERGPQQWPFIEKGRERLYEDGVFPTPSGRARFVAAEYVPPAEAPDADFPLRLTTGRLRDQWHSMTRTGLVAKLFGHSPQPEICLHPRDMKDLGLAEGDFARVASKRGAAIFRARGGDDLRRGDAFVAMHWGSRFTSGAGANALTLSAFDPFSKQPELKHAAVRVDRVAMTWRRSFACAATADAQRAASALLGRFDYAGLSLSGDLLCLELAAVAQPEAQTLAALEDIFGAAGMDAPQGRLVCACFSVSEEAIRSAAQAGATLACLQADFKCGTNCGSCVPELRRMLRDEAPVTT
jgi:assimilatory nitrate reductase catalytic subunit